MTWGAVVASIGCRSQPFHPALSGEVVFNRFTRQGAKGPISLSPYEGGAARGEREWEAIATWVDHVRFRGHRARATRRDDGRTVEVAARERYRELVLTAGDAVIVRPRNPQVFTEDLLI